MQNKHPKLTILLALTALAIALGGSLADARSIAGQSSGASVSSSIDPVTPASGDPDVPQKRLRPLPWPDDGSGRGGFGWGWFPGQGRVWTIWFLGRWFAD
jgi:hypothetical protein